MKPAIKMASLCLVLGASAQGLIKAAEPGDVNVSLGKWRMAATASSSFDSGYTSERAIDGTSSESDYFRYGGSVGIVSSSHQDTAWMDTPDFCRNYRVESVIVPALEMMKDSKYYFAIMNRS